MMKNRRKPQVTCLCTLVLFFHAAALTSRTPAQGVTGSIKGTVSATAGDTSTQPELVPGARLTLVNRDLPNASFKTVSDDTGNFGFLELPAGYYILTVEANALPRVTREIHLTTG